MGLKRPTRDRATKLGDQVLRFVQDQVLDPDERSTNPEQRTGDDQLNHFIGDASDLGVAEQRVDRRQPPVAGACLVAALALEVVEERSDQRRIEIADVQRGRLFPRALGSEGQQQAPGVAVAGDRVRACVR